ncbi:hypothetical protein ACLEWU_05115 [Escherichia coli]
MKKHHFKKLVKQIKFSHIACLAVGILIPIYIDVLGFHEFNSSTVSAIMDTVLASIATYTLYKVKNWYNEKTHTKGFEQANNFIVHLSDAKLKSEKVFEHIMNMYCYLGTKNLGKTDPHYEKLNNEIETLWLDYKTHLSVLSSQKDILKVWEIEIRPDQRDGITQYISTLYKFSELSQMMIFSYKDVNGMARKKSYEFNQISFNQCYALTQILSTSWMNTWRSLFVITKSTTHHD